jgi:hypothetical protein
MLVCPFVGRKKKPEKFLRSSSLSRPINTARRHSYWLPAAADEIAL